MKTRKKAQQETEAAANDNLFPPTEGHTAFQRLRAEIRLLRKKLTYTRLLTHVPYLAFLAFLALIYIANGHRTLEIQREINQEHKELKELRWRYMDVKTRLMNVTMESKMIVSGARIGLKPLTLPAYSILVPDATNTHTTTP